jgi:hypothetical protein
MQFRKGELWGAVDGHEEVELALFGSPLLPDRSSIRSHEPR